MFERYTEKARRVIFFARYEASQFGASTIEAEHVLLGLLREDKGLTNRFFPRSQGSIESIRKEIEERLGVGEKISTSVDMPLSPAAKHVLGYAQEESERLQHRYVGTEHLLLGLLREEKSLAAEILYERGLRLNQIREELGRSAPAEAPELEREDEASPRSVASARSLGRVVPLSPVAMHVLAIAWEEAERLGHERVFPEHLLAGIIRAGGSRAARLLAARGVTLDAIEGEDET
jgi:ATP-dependent Clp protease ATP-binding subunit ClpA